MGQVTAYLYPQCSSCRKAKSWLEEHGYEVNVQHIVNDPPSAETLKQLQEVSGEELKKFFNTSGIKYRELGLKDKLPDMSESEQFALLASDGKLIKRPIVTDDKKVTLGFKENLFADVWGK